MSVLAVPRSIERSFENIPRKRLIMDKWNSCLKGQWRRRQAANRGATAGQLPLRDSARGAIRATLLALPEVRETSGNYSMSIQRADIEKLAELARIHLSEDTATATAEGINRVLELIDQLRAADTTGIA